MNTNQWPLGLGADESPGSCTVRRRYLEWLAWSFTLFNTARMAAYLPTIAALVRSGDSSQHSLWTWGVWLGANVTMAAWLYEHNGQRTSRAVAVNIGNAIMCLATVIVILWFRLNSTIG